VSFLLDTNIHSAYLRTNHLVANKMMQYSGRLFVSAITAAPATSRIVYRMPTRISSRARGPECGEREGSGIERDVVQGLHQPAD